MIARLACFAMISGRNDLRTRRISTRHRQHGRLRDLPNLVARLHRWAIALLAAMSGPLWLAIPSTSQSAVYNWQVDVAFAPAGANDIHLVFTGTGGSVGGRTGVTPAAQDFTGSPANGISASFAAFAGGETYSALFSTIHPHVAFDSGFWTMDGVNVGAIAGGNTSLILTGVIGPIPEPETYAMLLAGLGLLGVVRYRRQRKQV